MGMCWTCMGCGSGPAEGNSPFGSDSEGLFSNGPMESCPDCGGSGQTEGWFE